MSKHHEFIVKKGRLKGKKIVMNFAEPVETNSDDASVNVAQYVINRSYEIIQYIVEPILDMERITADIYLADLVCYAEDDVELKKILDAIATKYQVDREYLECLKNYPIGLIALYTLENDWAMKISRP